MTEKQSNKIQEVADKLAVEAWKELGNNKIFIGLEKTKLSFDNALHNAVKNTLQDSEGEYMRKRNPPMQS